MTNGENKTNKSSRKKKEIEEQPHNLITFLSSGKFVPIIFFLLIPTTLSDGVVYYTVHRQASLRRSLKPYQTTSPCHCPREFSSFHPQIRPATFLLFGSRLCFSFNPRTFLFLRTFHVHEMISIATRTTTLECKQKMLISLNRISRIKPLPRKLAGRSRLLGIMTP